MNWKINRNQKQKYSKEEKLALEEDKKYKCSNRYCPGGWQQHFWIDTKLMKKKSSIYHLKMF